MYLEMYEINTDTVLLLVLETESELSVVTK